VITYGFDYYDFMRKTCEDSYAMFVKAFWPVVNPNMPLVWNWHMQYLCDELQACYERVFRGEDNPYDLVVNVPPGSSKSTIFSVMALPWAWTRYPSLRFIGASYVDDLAMDLSVRSRRVVQSRLYRQLWPDILLASDTNMKSHWANTLGGERWAVAVGGSVTGFHGHVIAIDDPLDPIGARSDAEIEAAKTWCSETIPTRKVSKTVSHMGLVMQRVHESDPTAHMLAVGKAVRHVCLPAELSPHVRPRSLRKYYVDGLLDPVRMPRNVLRDLEKQLGIFGYAGQVGQHPIPRGGGIFYTDKVQRGPQPLTSDFAKILRFWDKAATKDAGAYSVGTKMGLHKNGSIWVLDVVRGQLGIAERDAMIKSTAKSDGRRVRQCWEEEGGSSGKTDSFHTVRMLAGYLASPQRPTGNKVDRAGFLASRMNVGDVWVPTGVPWYDAWVAEFRFFPNSTYKDQVDSASGAYNTLVRRGRLGKG
jgi:predicted phage terminase large subunit-like protein